MSFDTHKLLNNLVEQILFVMRFAGCNPSDNSLFGKTLWLVLVCFNSTWIALSAMTSRKLENMERIGNNIICILGMSQILSELLVIRANSANFQKMMTILRQKFWQTEEFYPEKSEQHRKFYQILTRAAQSYGFYFLLICVSIIIDPVLKGSREHPVELRVPDPEIITKSPYYEIIYLLQTFTIFVAALAGTILFDILYFVMILSVWIQFDILKYRLSTINTNMKKNEAYETLKICVEHHNLLLDFLQDVQIVFTYSLLNKMLSDVFVMCFTNYLLMSGKVIFRVKYPFLIMGAVIQTFFYCTTGDVITSQCSNIADVAYAIEWEIIAERRVTSGLSMIITRAQKDVKIQAGRILELSFANFIAIVKAAFSYYVFLKEGILEE